MASSQILRIRRTDDPSAHLLLNVTQSTSKTRPLDLKLVATEHEHLYHGALKTSNVASLRASNNRGDEGEWRDILVYALLRRRSEGASSDTLQGLEIVAAVAGEICTITIRKNIGGITQRLGSIKLAQDDEKEEVGAFEWVDSAVASADDLRSQLEVLQVSFKSQQNQVARLTSQLDELVRAKKDHEDALLQKFAALLNAKKLKIRDQQRLLNGAKVDPRAASAVSEERNGNGKRRTDASARAKRKADLSPDEPEEMANDPDAAADEDPDDDALSLEEEEGQRTPDQESTAEEASEDDEGFAPPPAASSQRTASQRNGGKAGNAGKEAGKMDIDASGDLPPKRELPFSSKKEQNQKPSAPPEVEDEDETDDEL